MSNKTLPDFEGRTVTGATIRVTGAGDGLSKALGIAPQAWHHGDEIYLVIKAKIVQVNHRPAKEDEPDLVRVHTARAEQVVEASQRDVGKLLRDAAKALEEAEDKAKGQERIPLEDGEKSKRGRRYAQKVAKGLAEPEGHVIPLPTKKVTR